MERKLLSLPSFFVLLLITGIAFLAAPVVDVDAGVPTVTTLSSGVVGGNVVVTITFSEAVKLSADAQTGGETAGAESAADGFGLADLSVKRTVTLPTASAEADVTGLTAANLKGDGSATTSDTFTLTVPITPAASEGSIKVTIKSATGTDTASFQAVTGDDPYAGDGTDTVTQAYDTLATTVTIAAVGFDPADDKQNGPFEVTFSLTEAPATTGAGVFVVDKAPDPPDAGQTASPADATTGDVTITGGTITQDARNPGTNVWRAIITPTPSTETAKTTEVKIKVAAGAVMDAAGNGNAESNELTVMIDNDAPTVTIAPAYPDAADQGADATPTTPARPDKDGIRTGTDGTHSAYYGDNAFKIRVTIEGADDAELDAAEDLTLTGGTVSGNATADPATLANDYIVSIMQDNTQATMTVQIQVPEGAIMDAAGNSNKFSDTGVITVSVAGGDPVDTGTDEEEEDTGKTGTLTAGQTFKFTLTAEDIPAVTTSRFVVIARDAPNSATNGISGAGKVVNINDDAWKDLQDFLAYDGGTIDLIGPPGTLKGDLVISEVMWGNDAGLDNPNNSQWIELYNTRSTKTGETRSSAILAGEWTLEFRAGGNPPSETSITNFSDRFSNRTLGGGHWNFPNTAGGKYGQSGRTKLSPGVSGALRDLVSMRRKIDYPKVEKNDHKDATGENRTEQLKGIPDGALAGSWEASTSRVNMSGTRKGTPGAKHVVVVGTTSISKSVVFNEIANREEDKNDWIELYNPGGSDVKINNWVITKVTKVGTDEVLFKFESDENIVVPSKGFLLVVNEDPSETSLSAGENVDNPGSKANGLPTQFYITDKLKIPKDKFLFILRTEDKKGTDEKIVDIAGHLVGLSLVHDGNATELWPLKAWKRIKEDDLGQNNDKTWVRDKGKDLYHGDAWKPDGGVTGLGIDRNATSRHSGTPGFDNGAVKGKVKDLSESDPVVISEIMFGSGGTGNRSLPQWIELYNPSKTQAVNLDGWRLEVQNASDATEDLNVKLNYELRLPAKRILPNQTILIVSASGDTNDDKRFPSDRIINVWSTRTLRDEAEMSGRRDALLSSIGFYLKLSDPDKVMVDEVGNIEGNKRNNKPPDWVLKGGNLDDGSRASMVRVDGTAGNGKEDDAWRPAQLTVGGEVGVNQLYYGDEDDYGTPGYTPGGPLPVQLSSFYSKRNDTGAVVITWSTESELDNAGFNILRSQSRTGEFVRINAQLIPGAGTTGEKTAYTWTDTGASPNVLYFYQIEDVSLAGDHRTLRTTRLRGYIGAAGKVTTTWGDLKSRE